ncbi:hypothetical protein [Actibacterium sp. 188UL27-1]|uniref:hypothetical protein n=1 Tax=Actibacterium sp. 188UL27-1 TaxID=2786961 RepID=UPI0019560552|nr:hypothetical protein [Actibacterium sp. 188UL27-1]MBM7068424.1 hypothetical protein [Actibacterium sp. 188UL27-1]
MSQFIWNAETPGGKDLDDFDPYSVWSLRYAADFDFAAMAEKDNKDDFKYDIVVYADAQTEVEKLDENGRSKKAIDVVKERSTTRTADTPNESPQTVSTRIFLEPTSETEATIEETGLTKENARRKAPANLGDQDAKSVDAQEKKEQQRKKVRDKIRYRAPLRESSICKAKLTDPNYVSGNYPKLKPGCSAIIGIVDDGINLINDRFSCQHGAHWHSRVDFGWVMDGKAQPKSTVAFGREYTRDQLDLQVQARDIPERDRLMALDLVNFARTGQQTVSRMLSHGTHVADLAAGFDPQDNRENARILAVQLPALVTMDTSGAWLAPFALAGISYILDRAFLMSKIEDFAIPVVINFSYGISGGPHNGQSVVERGIDTLLRAHEERMLDTFPNQPRFCTAELVMPTGNRFLDRAHAEKCADAKNAEVTIDLPWRVQPSDVTANFLEIWMPRAAKNVKVWVALPDGPKVQLKDLNFQTGLVLHPDGQTNPNCVIARATIDRQRGRMPSGTQPKKRVLLAIVPTQLPYPSTRPVAPSGIWTITVTAKLPEAGQKIEAWIQRDDEPIGYKRPGRPSYFDDPDYRRFDGPDQQGDVKLTDDPNCVVKRYGALNGMATGQKTRIIGGYMGPPAAHAALYAGAADKSTNGANHRMRYPCASAQSDTSRVLSGTLGSGTRSGSVSVLNGTSVAAPQMARYLVLGKLGLPLPQTVQVAGPVEQLGTQALPQPAWHRGTRRDPR